MRIIIKKKTDTPYASNGLVQSVKLGESLRINGLNLSLINNKKLTSSSMESKLTPTETGVTAVGLDK